MTQAVKNSPYDPNHLLNALIVHLGLSNDSALSRKLKVATDVISNIRDGRMQVCGSMLMWMHEATGISIEELRRLMGDRRAKCRLSYGIRSRIALAACVKQTSFFPDTPLNSRGGAMKRNRQHHAHRSAP